VAELFEQSTGLPLGERASFICSACGDDLDLREELSSLLRAHELTDGPLDAGPVLSVDASEPTDVSEVGSHVGAYRLLRPISEGGMGSVWLAERSDGTLKRTVALKRPHISWSGTLAARMAHERDILASLEHPNIARLYDAGADVQGRPYLALEYVEGQTIDVYCRERNLSIRDRISLVIDVAKALAYAHSKLVVHRDLKPANMLVTATGAVRLLDFGIAKLVEGDTFNAAKQTQFGGRLLTPDYASPEQIRGEAIGTASDIYSLAVVTYELLTGTRPYRLKRQSAAQLEEAIAEVDPQIASDAVQDKLLKRQLRGDLDAILNMAMKKAPLDRYATVDAFASDLQRCLSGQTVLARPDGVLYRLRKLAGRHRIGLGAAVAVLIALIAATAVSLLQAREAKQQAERATATKNFLLSVFRANDPRIASDRPRGEITARELLDIGSARIEKDFTGQPALQIELLGLTADMYDSMSDEGHYAAAQKRRIELARAYYGSNHPIVIQGLLNEADAACLREDYAKVNRLLDETDVSLRKANLDESVMRAYWWRTKARASYGLGRQVEFRHALGQALALYAKLAPRSNDYAVALNLASLDQTENGNALQAAQLLMRALAVAEAAPDRDDSSIADYLYNLARAQERLGEFGAAEGTYVRAEAQAKKTYGERNALYWVSLAQHARLLHQRGQRGAANTLFTQMLAAIPPDWSTNGNDKWAREIYAECLAAEGRVRDAVPLFDAAYQYYLKSARADFGVREVRRKLGDAYDRLGRTAEARTLLKAARDESVAKEGPSSPWVLRMHERWGRFLLDHSQESDPDLMAAGLEFNAVLEKAADRPLVEPALAHSGLSRIAAARGDDVLALRESGQALAALGRVQGLYDVRVQPRLWLVHSALLLKSGDPAGARQWADKALEASLRYDDPTSSAIAAARDSVRLAGATLRTN
jgi:serine/threonine-protein kinase